MAAPAIRVAHTRDANGYTMINQLGSAPEPAFGVKTATFCSETAFHDTCPADGPSAAPRKRSLGPGASHHAPLHVDYVFHNLDCSRAETARIIPDMCSAAGYGSIPRFFHDLSCQVVRKLYSKFFAAVDAGLPPDHVPEDVARPPGRKTMVCFADPSDGVGWTYGPAHDRKTTSHLHFSTSFLNGLLRGAFGGSLEALADDYPGVIVHEFTHAWQNDGFGTMPGSCIEGVADWMRTNLGYAPDHWHLPASSHVRATKWTDESCTLFFCFLDRRYPGFVEEVNRVCGIETFFKDSRGQPRDLAARITGRTWEQLWGDWGDWLQKVEKQGGERSWRRIYQD
ncbi:peptidase of plants and bacteria-domain-containing protein [Hyaloraphidium curvatum]|nr:peptidase of plants and bacteria-domain-containing protein [Hyaloraphidium curvatum]